MFFQVLLDMPQLSECGFIIFLNKRDVFEQKINLYRDLYQFFSKFLNESDANKILPVETAEMTVAKKFEEVLSKSMRQEDQLYVRFTTAIDPKLMESIFATVKTDIINRDLVRKDILFS